ncbi:hypothetical protein OG497_37795 [Streptomyces sp. NBC_01242]|uniref:hypothetical protein n=1 Tax=Streptomyces sp. NBC_01242 TaxID=2903795 RepID=UPI0022500322|nr:hypothetical protein [Streptomyces sp. NBC_01242]MCX4799612.1 hypothetical protein [Streptomyces sp. NBC_01242]
MSAEPGPGRTTTVPDVLGVDVTLREVERRVLQGGGRSDLVRCHAFLGETYIGEVDSYWILREDHSRSTNKEFAGTYPGEKDWGPSGRRIEVLAELVLRDRKRQQEALRADLAVLKAERDAVLKQLGQLLTSIDSKAAELTDLASAPTYLNEKTARDPEY